MGKRTQENRITVTANRNYKDRLFRLLFGAEHYKENLLELYNALNHCHYTNAEELEITTIENVIYIGMKNDTSFLLHGHMVLYEHQYTYNPNMPLRGLLYIGKLYQKYIEQREYNIYSSKLIKIPAPQYIVFYNGDDELPDRTTLKLSEAFEKPVEDCDSISEGINKAVDACIHDNVLKEFLIAHRGEVLEVLLTEFDEEKYAKAIKKEGYETGFSEGRETGFGEGREVGFNEGISKGQAEERRKNIKSMIEMYTEDGMDLESAIAKLSKKFSLTIDEIRKIL